MNGLLFTLEGSLKIVTKTKLCRKGEKKKGKRAAKKNALQK